jgi:hypothetical protein
MGTPALERLWQTHKCSQLFAVYYATLYLPTYTTPLTHPDKSESQVDNYSIFIYKESSVFPNMNCYRSQDMWVIALGSTTKKLRGRQVRLQAGKLLHTDLKI